jgi:hypothetical protein
VTLSPLGSMGDSETGRTFARIHVGEPWLKTRSFACAQMSGTEHKKNPISDASDEESDDCDYANSVTLDQSKVKTITKPFIEAEGGSGGAWIPIQIGVEFLKKPDGKGKLTMDLKLAFEIAGFKLDRLVLAASGAICFIADPGAKMNALLTLGELTVDGVLRPVIPFTKECLSDYTVVIHDTIEQDKGRVTTPAMWEVLLCQLGHLASPPYNPLIRYDGISTGVRSTTLVAHFKGEPIIPFGTWPVELILEGLGPHPFHRRYSL